MDSLLSLYTPSNTKPEILEQILVQRGKLLKNSVRWCEQSINDTKKNHLLFVGARGSGKTHIVSMILHRLKQNKTLKDKMLIVWLGEDEIVTNFLGFVLSIIKKLAQEHQFTLECLKEARGKTQDEASNIILESITEQLKDNTIVLVKENMSDVFNGLKEMGQRQFRAYLQEEQNMLVVATSKQLFKGVSSREAVFFGFFDIHHLKPLSVEGTIELIEKVSIVKNNKKLNQFIKTPKGGYRVEALHHLVGGNQRLYMELLEFLTFNALDNLVVAIDKLVDKLTSHFQKRIKSLSPQQGLIVQKLCDIEGAISVKILANEIFIEERSVSKQLGELKTKGYVLAHKRGKLTYYEVSEPLMRFGLQVKQTNKKPLKVLVLLLKAWFSEESYALKEVENLLLDNPKIWQKKIPSLLKKFHKTHKIEYVSKALIASLDNFTQKEEVNILLLKEWQEVWQKYGKNYEYLTPALKVLKSTSLALEQKNDKSLFRLSSEIRELVLPLVEGKMG